MLKSVVPTRAIVLLMTIGLVDLVSTAWLHSQGLIRELNPLMNMLMQHGETPFVIIKGLTLIVAWVVLAIYARRDLSFVRRACITGSAAYLTVWTVWFLSSR